MFLRLLRPCFFGVEWDFVGFGLFLLFFPGVFLAPKVLATLGNVGSSSMKYIALFLGPSGVVLYTYQVPMYPYSEKVLLSLVLASSSFKRSRFFVMC